MCVCVCVCVCVRACVRARAHVCVKERERERERERGGGEERESMRTHVFLNRASNASPSLLTASLHLISCCTQWLEGLHNVLLLSVASLALL